MAAPSITPPPLCWYLADDDGAYVSLGFWEIYQQGLKPLAGFLQSRQVSEEGPDKTQHLVLSLLFGIYSLNK